MIKLRLTAEQTPSALAPEAGEVTVRKAPKSDEGSSVEMARYTDKMRPTKQPVLMTDRLLLRPFQETDFERVHAYGANPEVSQFMPWGPNSEDDTRSFITQCVIASHSPSAKGYMYAITLRDDAGLIGGCGLSYKGKEKHTAELGYCLHPDHWGKGYMTEAGCALLTFAFQSLGLHRAVASCDPRNKGSWRVMEKLGMRREAYERQSVFVKGRWQDCLRYAILRSEWAAREK